MLLVVESAKSVAEIAKSFPAAVARHKFGVLGVHNLREKMNEKGVAFDRDCLVFEVCNPVQAAKVLAGNMGVSTMLPCRVSVYAEGGKTRLATLAPTGLLGMFGAAALQPVAKEVEDTLLMIMKEAAG